MYGSTNCHTIELYWYIANEGVNVDNIISLFKANLINFGRVCLSHLITLVCVAVTGCLGQDEKWRLSDVSPLFSGLLRTTWAWYNRPGCDHICAWKSAKGSSWVQPGQEISSGEGAQWHRFSWTWYNWCGVWQCGWDRSIAGTFWLWRAVFKQGVASWGGSWEDLRWPLYGTYQSSVIICWAFTLLSCIILSN